MILKLIQMLLLELIIYSVKVVIKRNVFIHGNNNIEETIINNFSRIGPFCRLKGGNKIGKGVNR